MRNAVHEMCGSVEAEGGVAWRLPKSVCVVQQNPNILSSLALLLANLAPSHRNSTAGFLGVSKLMPEASKSTAGQILRAALLDSTLFRRELVVRIFIY
jgi:hypothetical protein